MKKTTLSPGSRVEIAVVSNGLIISLRGEHLGDVNTAIAIAENLLDIGAVLNEYFTLPTLEDHDAQKPHDDRLRSEGATGGPIDPDYEEVPGADQIEQAPGTNEDGSPKAEGHRTSEAAAQ